MDVKRADGSKERTVLIGMIVDKTVLGAIASKWTPGMFSSRWGNLIAGWCVSYYTRYRKVPGKNIQTLFDEWANAGGRDKETVDMAERFLSSISGEYSELRKTLNAEYVIDIASTYFGLVQLRELSDMINSAIETGDLTSAEEMVNAFCKVKIGGADGVDVFNDAEAMRKAFDAKSKSIIEYKHGLGIFYGSSLERDGLIAFMGPEKRGKTWQLIDMAWTAVMQGLRVAFFEVGDMSQNQIMMRLLVRAAKHPTKPRTVRWPKTLVLEEGEKTAIVEHEDIVFSTGLDFDKAYKACQRIVKKRFKTGDKDLLKLSVHPNSSISVHGVRTVLDFWARQDWIPDVVVIDYADILAPVTGIVDSRDQINATWKGLRALSQSMHCLVVTATQAKATSYTVETIGKQEFAEDKRKLAHATGIIGLNQIPKEKDLGILRQNWVVLREEEFSEQQCCHVAQCLSLGRPAVISVM